MRLTLLAIAAFSCSRTPPRTPVTPVFDTATEAIELSGDAVPDPDDDLSGLRDLPCYSGQECASEGPYLGNTCCTYGDNLVELAQGLKVESVDIEKDGDDLVACGGFGGSWASTAKPKQLDFFGTGSNRCQRIALGPHTDDGGRIFWLAHHGDSWVDDPQLWTIKRTPEGITETVDNITDPAVLFEGLDYEDDRLYVATHGGGLRVYDVAEDGKPTLNRIIGGFDNALKVHVVDGYAHVIDKDKLHIIDIGNLPGAEIETTYTLAGTAWDLFVHNDRIYVALGGTGVEVISRNNPTSPTRIELLETGGSAQAVHADGNLLAVAAWSSTLLIDTRTLKIIGTERHISDFEQALGVVVQDGRIFSAQWAQVSSAEYKTGFVAADIHVQSELFSYIEDVPDTKAVTVENRGPMNLVVYETYTNNPSFEVEGAKFVVEPGQEHTFNLDYEPHPDGGTLGHLQLVTNDPDPVQNPLGVPFIAAGSALLDEGDKLDDTFAFLDPTGANDLSNVEGNVIVLAYFALY